MLSVFDKCPYAECWDAECMMISPILAIYILSYVDSCYAECSNHIQYIYNSNPEDV